MRDFEFPTSCTNIDFTLFISLNSTISTFHPTKKCWNVAIPSQNLAPTTPTPPQPQASPGGSSPATSSPAPRSRWRHAARWPSWWSLRGTWRRGPPRHNAQGCRSCTRNLGANPPTTSSDGGGWFRNGQSQKMGEKHGKTTSCSWVVELEWVFCCPEKNGMRTRATMGYTPHLGNLSSAVIRRLVFFPGGWDM